SRSSSGTSLSISSVERTISGSMSSTSARLTANALRFSCRKVTHTPKMKMAATTEGTPARTSTMKVVGVASLESGDPTSMRPAAMEDGATRKNELVHHVGLSTAGSPATMTLYSSAMSGTTASTKHTVNSTAAVLSLNFRLPETGRKVSAGLAGLARSVVVEDI